MPHKCTCRQEFKFSPDGKQVIVIRQVESTVSIKAKEKDLPLATGLVITDMNYRHWDSTCKLSPTSSLHLWAQMPWVR